MSFKSILIRFSLMISVGLSPTVAAPIQIVAALPDLGSIASAIGGDRVIVSTIAKASSNPHAVEVFPSYMARVSQAAIYLKCGLGLDQWSDAIIDGSRNNRITVVDCSRGVVPLDKQTHVDASMGDVHPFGNPHYWLDPRNGITVGQTIAAALKKADPGNSAVYEGNLSRFKAECDRRYAAWQTQLSTLTSRKIITYHSSWAYFADAFHLTIVAQIEPYPGIPPTGKHLAQLVDVIKKEQVSVVLQEPYFSDDATKFLSRQTGVVVCRSAPSCADAAAGSYFTHFDEIVRKLSSLGGGK